MTLLRGAEGMLRDGRIKLVRRAVSAGAEGSVLVHAAGIGGVAGKQQDYRGGNGAVGSNGGLLSTM